MTRHSDQFKNLGKVTEVVLSYQTGLHFCLNEKTPPDWKGSKKGKAQNPKIKFLYPMQKLLPVEAHLLATLNNTVQRQLPDHITSTIHLKRRLLRPL